VTAPVFVTSNAVLRTSASRRAAHGHAEFVRREGVRREAVHPHPAGPDGVRSTIETAQTVGEPRRAVRSAAGMCATSRLVVAGILRVAGA
jgi:hypothetical protein